MPIMGKLSPTSGCSISVNPANGLKGKPIRARLLLNDGNCYLEEILQVTMGNSINRPGQALLDWIKACGRSDADIRGRANERNAVHYFKDDTGWFNLHFSELATSRVVTHNHTFTPTARPVPIALVTSTAPKSIRPGNVTPNAPQPVYVLRDHRWADLPFGPGVYWWYFPESALDRFRIKEFCQMEKLHLRRAQDGKLCLYHGIATSLAQRAAWHAEQPLTMSSLRSGFLSTFRFTLLALTGFDYLAGSQEIDQFMDELSLSWMETVSLAEARDIEAAELMGEFHYPLNIQDNHRVELVKYIRFLKSMRKTYKHRYI